MNKEIKKGINMSYDDFIYSLKKVINFDENGNIILNCKCNYCNCNCKTKNKINQITKINN